MMLIALPLAAQDRPANGIIGGGVTFPVGDIADSFNTGGHFLGGVSFNFTETVGFQADYQYHFFGGPDRTFPGAPGSGSVLIESNHQMHMGTFNLLVKSPSSSPVAGYFLAGPGVYHRIVQLTTPTVGVATICDPYWFVCYPVAVSTDQVVGDRSSTDFGFGVGGGISFGGAARFFIEARYHYVWGNEFEAPNGTTRNSSASYFPITFGVKF
jgi:opacity protein-like surface antigen